MSKRYVSLLMVVLVMITVLSGCGSNVSTKPKTPVDFSLSQYSSTKIEVEVGEWARANFYLLPFDTTDEDLEIINSNSDIAECTFWTNGVAGEKICVINIKGLTEGSTTVYLKDKHSASESTRIDITVFVEEEEVDNSRTVYINLNGDKYHYSKECAGKSAQETTLNKVIRYKAPCSKCVH